MKTTSTELRTDMYLLITFSCLCLLPGLHTENCILAVLAKRHIVYVLEGGSLSLSCVVQHCGGDAWKGEWMLKKSSEDNLNIFKPTLRHQLSNVTLSANQTRLFVKFLSVNKSDEGSYGCRVTWSEGLTGNAHMTYVNITSAVPSERSVLHRVLVCVGASLCFPVILGFARCLSSEVKPRPLPRTLSINHPPSRTHMSPTLLAPQPLPRCPLPQKEHPSTRKATSKPKPKPNTELVYAALSQDALAQQRAAREPDHGIVYSSLRFS